MEFKAEYFIPVDDRILVLPGPIKWIKVTTTEPDGLPRKAPKITPMKEVIQDTKPVYRVGKVLSIGTTVTNIEVGEWVVYKENTLAPFDLVLEDGKDILKERENLPGWVKRYDVYAKLSKEGIDIINNFKQVPEVQEENNNEEVL